MKITSKYILREHLGPLTFSLGALTSLLLLNYIARKFGDLVGKGIPWQAVAQFFVLSVPFTIAMTLPMAVLVAVLYAFSRLASENEVTAFKASGVSMGRLLAPVLWGATLTAAGMIFFNDQVLPRANHRLSWLQGEIARTSPTIALKEQVLNEFGDGFRIRTARIDHSHEMMHDVTIYDMSQTEPRTITADSGQMGILPDGTDLQLTLFDGDIKWLGAGKPDQLQHMLYDRQLVRVRNVLNKFDPSKPGSDDFKSDREMSICELQRAYIRARTDYFRAELDYRGALADSAKRQRPRSIPPRRVFLGVGRLYCDAIQGIGSLIARPAQAQTVQPPAAQPPAAQPPPPAAQPPAAQPPAAQPPRPDSVRRDGRDSVRRDSVRADTTRPAPAPPSPAPVLPAAPVVPTVPSAPGVPAAQLPPPAVSAADSAAAAVAPPVVVPQAPAGTPVAEGPNVFGATTLDLTRLRVRETRGQMNGYDVEIHKKFALAIACIVFVLLGAPLAIRFPRGGVGLVIGVSLLVFATYYSFLIAGEELANRGYLPPWISMWAANVLFTLAALPLAWRMGRESGSARGGGVGEWLDNLRFRRQRARAVSAARPS